MTRIYIDFTHEQAADEVANALQKMLPEMQRSEVEPFSQHIDEQSRLAKQVAKTERGREAMISSVERLSDQLGPGVRLTLRLNGVTCNILVSRRWIRIRCQDRLSLSDQVVLRDAIRSVADGELDEWEAEDT